MANPSVIAITTYRRPHLLQRAIYLAREAAIYCHQHTGQPIATILVSDDASDDSTHTVISQFLQEDYPGETCALVSPKREGVIASMNRVVEHCRSIQAPFLCEVQDDFHARSPEWFMVEMQAVQELETQGVAFVSGFHTPRHKTVRTMRLKSGMMCCIKHIEGFVNIMGRMSEWTHCFPMRSIQYVTGRRAGFPDNGVGSHIDWNLFRDHPQSVRARGKVIAVLPGLVSHGGAQESTWKKTRVRQ